jgi:hypothetical protein
MSGYDDQSGSDDPSGSGHRPHPAAGRASSPSDPDVIGTGRQEATTFARLPQFTGAALMPETEGRLLAALRAQIEQLDIELADSGIRHEDGRYVVLPKTLRSAWLARVKHPLLGEMNFLVGQTRSTWVLLYDKPHERVYEDPRFMAMELKRRDVALTPKGKRMYVSRIERKDLDLLNAIAAQDAGTRPRSDTLAPAEGSFSYEETMSRLRLCRVEHCTDPQFDLQTFVETVHFMTPTQSSKGNYYYLDAGDPEDPMACELHVGRDPGLPADSYGHKATLSYRRDPSYLYIDIRFA